MRQWKKFTNPPQEGELILVPDASKTSLLILTYSKEEFNDRFYEHWQSAEGVVNAATGYDPAFGMNKMCLCGHPYYRHFDTYDDMLPVGCKYCYYSIDPDDAGVEYRKETRIVPPEGLTDEEWSKWYEANKQPHSLCSGFKWDETAEDESDA